MEFLNILFASYIFLHTSECIFASAPHSVACCSRQLGKEIDFMLLGRKFLSIDEYAFTKEAFPTPLLSKHFIVLRFYYTANYVSLRLHAAQTKQPSS